MNELANKLQDEVCRIAEILGSDYETTPSKMLLLQAAEVGLLRVIAQCLIAKL